MSDFELSEERKIDVEVAEKVFGYTLDYEFVEIHAAPAVPQLRDQYDEWGALPEYSKDPAAAMLAADKMIADGYEFTANSCVLDDRVFFAVRFSKQEISSGTGLNASFARSVSRAALDALAKVGEVPGA